MPTTINPSDQVITQYNVQTGGASNLLNNVAPSATSGVPLISQGAASQPVFGTVLVAGGGTGLATLTAHSLQVGNGTTALTQLAVGATGTVLTGVTGADPAFSATPTVTSITFGSGSALNTYTQTGTWTPTIVGFSVAGTTTYTAQTGIYSRIGNIVTAVVSLSISAATGTGAAVIGAFPFAFGYNATGAAYLDAAGWTWPVARTNLAIYGIPGQTNALLACSGTAVAEANMVMANAAMTVIFSITYLV